MMPISAAEQYLIELINNARLDPLAEAERYDLDLNAGLAAGTIGAAPLQVLAPDAELSAAAAAHSAWMLAANVFSHTGVGASTPGARMQAAGFVFEGRWTWSENLAWAGTTGTIDMAAAIASHHEGLYRSAGHRVNTFGADVREIGVAQVAGTFDMNGTTYNSSMLTEQFALSGGTVFVTGVTYADTDGDGFYSIGEGRSDLWFMAGDVTAQTADAGGYALGLDGVSDLTNVAVQIGQGDTALGQINLDMSAGNVKVDVITQAGGGQVLAVSGHTTLGDGFDAAVLLGAGDLNLTGNNSANVLTGNHGDNVLLGGAGGDRLNGGDGNDRLLGDDGRDVLIGGAGYDRLSGGAYHDRLYGGDGGDRMAGGGGNDYMIGGNGHDRLAGGYGHDRLAGGNGHDRLSGGNGHDYLYGGHGHDRLYGGNGNDHVSGGNGNDLMAGGNGADRLNGGNGNDQMTGGAGADTFIFGAGTDTVRDFEIGVDQLIIGDHLFDGGNLSDHAQVTNSGIVLTFSDTDALTLEGLTDISLLTDAVIFV